MHKPMITNTLEDAALWLTKAMGRDWTARQVLDAVIRTCDQTAEYPMEDITCLRVLPPKNTVFGIYKRDPESYAVALQCLTLDCEFQLTFNAAFDLFTRNETNVSIIKNAVSNDEPYVVIEPRAESLRVTLDMVRISAGALQGLAMAYEQEKRLLPIKQDDYLSAWGDGLEHVRLITTHAYLAKIAHLHQWDTHTARKLIVNCTAQLSKWDGSLLAVLKAGPQADTQQPAPAQNPAKPAPVADSEWVTQAQTRAREIVKESRELDRYPSQENLGDLIASEFRKAGIVGADGKPLTGATIKRHALKGISSATGKQLSTTIGRGK